MKKHNERSQCRWVMGIDEAGRGPLAGPVAVGVVKIRASEKNKVLGKFDGIKDSKKLTKKARDMWFQKMLDERTNGGLDFCVSMSSNKMIDERGIVPAIEHALTRGLSKLCRGNGKDDIRILLDGALRAPSDYKQQRTIIRGDETERIISMASVVAKVMRDRKMLAFGRKYLNYAFERHMGYGTSQHQNEISRFGLSTIHRKTYCATLLMRHTQRKG